MRTEIYIENQRLDLYKDISTEFTYNIDDVKDFSARNTNFSKTIILPGNATNNKLFGHIFEFGSANFYNPTEDNVGYNFNASKAADCIVYVDKIQLFKGIIRLLEIVIDNGSIEYECAVFGELGGLVSSIGNKKIEELDFSAYNHTWEKPNIVNSWDSIIGEGYYYPLIDYGQFSHNNKLDFEIGTFRPALYVKEYIDKIITGAGYTYESTFFETNLYKRLIIPNNQKFLSTAETTQLQTTGDYPASYYTALSTQSFFMYWNNPTKSGGFTFTAPDTFTYSGASLTATARIVIVGSQNVEDNENANTYLDYYKNGVMESSTLIASRRDDFNLQLDIPITLASTDYIYFKIRFTGVTDYVSLAISEANLLVFTDIVVDTPIAQFELIEVNKTIPRGIFQKDFLSSIIKMFNLYVTESTDKRKHLIIEPYIDYYNFSNVIDWTLKVDRSKPFRIKPMSELNGRYFEFKYKPDSDYYNETYAKKYGQGYADILEDSGFEFANDKQTAEIIFASSPLVGYAGKDKVMTTIFKITNSQNVKSEDQMDSVIRIMQAKKITGVVNWHIKSVGGGNIGTHLEVYGYAGHLDDPDVPTADINFGAPKEIFFSLVSEYPSANLFNGYWSDYVAEITDKDSKLITCNVRLNDLDIFNLNFSRPILIDGSLWRLNKIQDYNPMVEDTTKCELIKVIEQTYA